jgi:hypothetical protein
MEDNIVKNHKEKIRLILANNTIKINEKIQQLLTMNLELSDIELIYRLNYNIGTQISQKLANFNNIVGEGVRSLYGIQEEINIIQKIKGLSSGFIIKSKSKTIFVKESVYRREENSIDPTELLLYKYLELLGYGPKVQFLLKEYAISKSGRHVCYICSEDVSFTKKKNKTKTFVTDSYFSEETEDKNLIWNEAFKRNDFCIDLLAMSIVDDMFYINDSFINVDNYGVIRIEKVENEIPLITYRPIMVDHLPGKDTEFIHESLNGLVESLNRKTNHYSYVRDMELLCNLAKSSVERLLYGVKGKKYLGIFEAVEEARREILSLINSLRDYFISEADRTLNAYHDKCIKNLEKLKSLYEKEYYKNNNLGADKSNQKSLNLPNFDLSTFEVLAINSELKELIINLKK